MRAIGFAIAILFIAAPIVSAPSQADPSLAGRNRFTVSHGQPFCASRLDLQALLHAQISKAPYDGASVGTCQVLADNAVVTILQDLSPRRRYMHVVRAVADTGFGTIEGYTYSVGLYRYPVRPEPFVLHLY